uniref:Putative secreted protein n=1 Tax=Xenopsylla cheopis TaxID=163159 RepID=A0A6M2E0Q0_XENCH
MSLMLKLFFVILGLNEIIFYIMGGQIPVRGPDPAFWLNFLLIYPTLSKISHANFCSGWSIDYARLKIRQ